MSEAERDEKQTTEPVERASAFEMSIVLLLIRLLVITSHWFYKKGKIFALFLFMTPFRNYIISPNGV